MKNSKHTPGPWELYNYKTEVLVYGQPHSRNVATVTGNSADARLIAAAPEMLEYLEIMLDWAKSGKPIDHMAKVSLEYIIGKAKGGAE